jgi:hypothetical protein
MLVDDDDVDGAVRTNTVSLTWLNLPDSVPALKSQRNLDLDYVNMAFTLHECTV